MLASFLLDKICFNFVGFGDDVYTSIYANKSNQAIIDQVNDGFEKIKENGRYQKINEKWFGDKASHFSVDENVDKVDVEEDADTQ